MAVAFEGDGVDAARSPWPWFWVWATDEKPFSFEVVEEGVEGPVFEIEDGVGAPGDLLGDGVPVRGPVFEDGEDEDVGVSLEELGDGRVLGRFLF